MNNQTKFVINPSSVDYTAILADIITFVESHPDNSKWNNYFASGVGETLLELMAGVSAYFEYQVIVGRRECYFQFAQNRSSIIGGAEYLGYSAYRGENLKLTLNVIPTVSITLQKFSRVGTMGPYDFVLLKEETFIRGVPITINVVVGDLVTAETLVNTDKVGIFRFSNSYVSEDIMLYVDGYPATYSNQIKYLDQYQFVVLTNPYESVDLFSINPQTSKSRYKPSSIIQLQFIKLAYIEPQLDQVTFDYGDIDSASILSLYVPKQENDSIKVLSPLYSETQFVIRGRNDVEKSVVLSNPMYIDAKGVDVSPAVINVAILKRDLSALTQAERLELQVFFESIRQFGMEPPTFISSERVPITINVDIWLSPPVPTNLGEEIEKIVQEYAEKLGAKIDYADLEEQIEDLDGIKIARVYLGGIGWSASDKFQIGQTITTTNSFTLEQMSSILYYSGSTEPTWPTTVGTTVVDNGVEWKTQTVQTQNSTQWAANTSYVIGNIRVPTTTNGFQYIVNRYLNYSGSTEPVWPHLNGQAPIQIVGETVEDNGILWLTLEQTSGYSTWLANTAYVLGDLVIPTNPTTSDTTGLMYQAVNYLGTTGTTAPTWDLTLGNTTVDNNILWKAVSYLDQTELEYNQYYIITTVVTTKQ